MTSKPQSKSQSKSQSSKREDEESDRRRHNEDCLKNARLGDMIEFPRGLYSHWAIYAGHGKVIHLRGESDDITLNDPGTVRIELFWKVVKDSEAIVNNFLDNEMEPLPEKYIISNAMSKLGAEGYDLVFRNCEHFATWCRYGRGRSIRVQNVANVLESLGAKVKDKLVDVATTSQNEKAKVLASEALNFGTMLALKGKEYIEENTDEELSNLNPKFKMAFKSAKRPDERKEK